MVPFTLQSMFIKVSNIMFFIYSLRKWGIYYIPNLSITFQVPCTIEKDKANGLLPSTFIHFLLQTLLKRMRHILHSPLFSMLIFWKLNNISDEAAVKVHIQALGNRNTLLYDTHYYLCKKFPIAVFLITCTKSFFILLLVQESSYCIRFRNTLYEWIQNPWMNFIYWVHYKLIN